MIDWASTYASSWRVMRVDPLTWADSGQLSGITEIDVSRKWGGQVESGSITVSIPASVTVPDGWYRIELIATQGPNTELVPIATLYITSGNGTWADGWRDDELEGVSVLEPADRDGLTMPDGAYAPMGTNGAEVIAQILRPHVVAPISVDGSFTLPEHIVYDLDATPLECAWTVADAGGLMISPDGYGTIHIMPKPTTPALVLDNKGMRLMLPEVETSEGGNTADWEREWADGVTVGSVVRCNIPSRGISGDYRIVSQSIDCAEGIRVSDTAERI